LLEIESSSRIFNLVPILISLVLVGVRFLSPGFVCAEDAIAELSGRRLTVRAVTSSLTKR
jgi:hypothetical protein